MATAQTDNLYQPAEHGGQGFHKISVSCNEGKKAFIDRALPHSDYQTKWAIRMLINRAGANWPMEGPQGPIEECSRGDALIQQHCGDISIGGGLPVAERSSATCASGERY